MYASLNDRLTFNPGPAERRNIWATPTNLLCIARKYLYALSDLLINIRLRLSIGPSTEPVHDPKQLHFKDFLTC